MRCLHSLACWFFLIFISNGVAVEEPKSDSTGTLEIDLVFPRNESTFVPSLMTPFVFSFQPPQLVPILLPYLIYRVYNYSNTTSPALAGRIDRRSINLSANGDPHFEVNYHRQLDVEGKWLMTLISGVLVCYEDRHNLYNNSHFIDANYTETNITFTTKGPSGQVDLAAETSEKNCPSPVGLHIDVQDTIKIPEGDFRAGETVAEVCAVEPLVTLPDKCVAVTPAATSSIAAEMSLRVCSTNYDNRSEIPESFGCKPLGEEESMGVQILFEGTTCLALLLGALVYIL
ncbi:hypothetical protein FGSG_10562 [Fusarium graminearum PH-1]|uniref:Chromosome 1, complete genome n=1 Tax=Gibberella zeae (strain ATCC MYA-4620 / CBS 123657 / FGSC 9075 / NRRL 31084 / PH-1) TaxID=229533 RepID=I1S1G1_GIBZE|nr:hypothetical protein FGSG_10562 [Fusarium graminearum PH-1]ESU17298.1 hypothetical protein FGSG_10562 [Fusarium graminearum PH-1]CEF76011.1 unnamed protein product [Fusarium graminearum]|eukprot:XP_011319560.1 hypothetical protein FGSG_10562 [Fusarium graminearum PH-1]